MQTKDISIHHFFSMKTRRKSVYFPMVILDLEDERIQINWYKIGLVVFTMILILILALGSIRISEKNQTRIKEYQNLIASKDLQLSLLQSQLEKQQEQLESYHFEVDQLELEVKTTFDLISKEIENSLSTIKK
jgi:uncharacterized protein YpmS